MSFWPWEVIVISGQGGQCHGGQFHSTVRYSDPHCILFGLVILPGSKALHTGDYLDRKFVPCERNK